MGDAERNETDLERADRNFGELLQELRVVGTGVQVLFAFLLILPFSAGFGRLAEPYHYLYFAILLAAAGAAGLLIAPTSLHRLIFRCGEKPYLVRTSNRLAIAGIACLTVAMTGILALIGGYLFGAAAGVIVGVAAAAFFGGTWFGIGLRRRERLNRRRHGRRRRFTAPVSS